MQVGVAHAPDIDCVMAKVHESAIDEIVLMLIMSTDGAAKNILHKQ